MATSPWDLLTAAPSIFQLITSLLSQLDRRALRETNRATRDAIDCRVSKIRLELENTGIAHAPLQVSVGDQWSAATSVWISDCQNSWALERIIAGASIRWPYLNDLCLTDCQFDETGAILSLLTGQRWQHLTALDLEACALSSGAVEMLARLDAPNLCRLDLSSNFIQSVQGLRHVPWGTSLKSLALCHNRRLDISQAADIFVTGFPTLEELNLCGVPVKEPSMHALVLAVSQLTCLRRLILRKCGLDDAGVMSYFEACGSWDHLRHLDVGYNEIRLDRSLNSLARASMSSLRSLSLSGNTNLHADALSSFAASNWPLLERFRISDVHIRAKGMEGLTRARLPSLRTLGLHNCFMSWCALDVLADRGSWPQLRRLDLGGRNGVQIRRAGSSFAMASQSWDRLSTLTLKPMDLTSVRAKTYDRLAFLRLRKRWPELIIIFQE